MEQEAIYKIILEGTKAEAKGMFDLEREKMRAKGQLQKAEGKISGSFESSEDQISGSIEMGEMEPS